jgi:hypothetical protein
MTIRTPDLAFIYFLGNASPTHAATDHVTDIPHFLAADVVEFKDSRVALAAINTRMES